MKNIHKKKPGRKKGAPKKMVSTRITLEAYALLAAQAKQNGKTLGAEIADRLERMAQ